MRESLVGRQPIYNRDLEVFGYELLFRTEGADTADFEDGDAATSHVILSAFHEIGMQAVVGRKHAFLNLTRGFIVGEYPLPVPTAGVVLEVLEHVEPDREVLRGLADLVERGYTIALDDFVLDGRTAPFLEFADIVKVDIDALDREQVRAQLAALRVKDLLLVAEQVRTSQDFEDCLALGFDLYQGFFLSRPNVVRGRRVPANRIGVLRLLARISDPTCDLDELEGLISQDVTLTYKLLRYINSTSVGMPRRIESIRETVVYLGRDAIRGLAGLLVLSGMDDRPRDLLVSAMLRARMCELLANAEGLTGAAYFTTGMFSTLSALLQCSMEEVVRELPLVRTIEDALLGRGGEIGEALSCVLAYEQGEWEGVHYKGLSTAAIKQAFLGAVKWAEDFDRELLQAG